MFIKKNVYFSTKNNFEIHSRIPVSDISYTLTKYFNWYNCFYVRIKYHRIAWYNNKLLIVKCRENRNSDGNTNESNFICKTSTRFEVKLDWISKLLLWKKRKREREIYIHAIKSYFIISIHVLLGFILYIINVYLIEKLRKKKKEKSGRKWRY